MTTATGKPPAHRTPADHARVLLTAVVVGAALTAFISGCAASVASLVIIGVVLLPAYGLLFFLATIPRRVREAAVAPCTALAMTEDLEAVGGEGSEVPVRFDLTVAPDDGPAFRVEIRDGVNLVDLPTYRPRGMVVVQYPPDRPWKGRIPSQSMLDPGTLRSSVESLTAGAAPRPALTVVVQGNRLTVVFVPGEVRNAGFAVSSLPYDRIPALVQQAEKTPGVGSVKSWQVAAASAGGSLTLTVVVTGDKGAATLIADGQGKVLQHSGG